MWLLQACTMQGGREKEKKGHIGSFWPYLHADDSIPTAAITLKMIRVVQIDLSADRFRKKQSFQRSLVR